MTSGGHFTGFGFDSDAAMLANGQSNPIFSLPRNVQGLWLVCVPISLGLIKPGHSPVLAVS